MSLTYRAEAFIPTGLVIQETAGRMTEGPELQGDYGPKENLTHKRKKKRKGSGRVNTSERGYFLASFYFFKASYYSLRL